MFRKFYSAGRIETRTLEDIETGTHVSVRYESRTRSASLVYTLEIHTEEKYGHIVFSRSRYLDV